MYNEKIKEMEINNRKLFETNTKILKLEKALEEEQFKRYVLEKKAEILSKEAEKIRLGEVKKDIEKKPFKLTGKYKNSEDKGIER